MKWIVIYWFTICAGIDCPIEEYKLEFHETRDECMQAAQDRDALKIYSAVCIPLRSLPNAKKD